jgi:hypothetical protein
MAAESIPFQTLITILQRIAAGYAERGVVQVDISDKDFYLTIGTAEMFDVYSKPSEPLGVGSLVDDLKELTKLVNESDAFPTAVDVERLGNVLRAMSEVL